MLKFPFGLPGAWGRGGRGFASDVPPLASSGSVPTIGGRTERTPSKPVARRRLPRRWLALLAVVVIAAGGYLTYSHYLTTQAATALPQTVPVRRGTISSTVTSTGTVKSTTTANLTFSSSGRVAEVKVKAGDSVTKGQVLATLDTTDLNLALSQAKAGLSSAKAKLDAIQAGSRPEDIQAAQSALDAAKQKLAEMQAGGRPEDVASAQAAVESARANLAQLEAGPTAADVKAAEQAVVSAQAALDQAKANLAKLGHPSDSDIKAAQLKVEQAKDSLNAQNISRDAICGRNKNGSDCKQAQAQVLSAITAVDIAQASLDALLAPPTPEDLAAAQQAVSSAQAQLDSANAKLKEVKAGATPDQIAAARAALQQAEQTLALKQKPYTEADIQAQQQAVAQAEANLAAKKTPYTAADVQAAQAAVDQAQAALDQAQYNLDHASLVAPFDGVVSAVTFNPGESSANASLTMVDPNALRLEVNVDEADIAQVKVGQPATITFDALPGQTFQGKVSAINPSATVQSGVATYSVYVTLDKPGAVKPGMTGDAQIVYASKANALMVPNRAIRNQGRDRVVEVLVNGKVETRVVQVGLSNDTMTEITAGLNEGDRVVINSTTAAQPRVIGPNPGFGGGVRMVGPGR